MATKKITVSEAVGLVFAFSGWLFRADFVKKTTGEDRRMLCRLGVKKYLKGGVLGYDANAIGHIIVADNEIMQSNIAELKSRRTMMTAYRTARRDNPSVAKPCFKKLPTPYRTLNTNSLYKIVIANEEYEITGNEDTIAEYRRAVAK